MATRPTDIPLTDIRVIRSRAMDTQVTPDTLLTPVLQAMDTKATRDSLLTPDPRPMDRRADRRTLPIPVLVMGPGYGYPSDHASENWSPGGEYAIELSSLVSA
jgi:hypothetical protein